MKCFKFLLILNVLSSNIWIKISRVDFKWENTDMVCLGFSPFLRGEKPDGMFMPEVSKWR